MAESKGFRVRDESGFIGTLDAPARFLDNRTEKIIKLDSGGELSVRADELKVQPDGSFLLLRRVPNGEMPRTPAAEAPLRNGPATPAPAAQPGVSPGVTEAAASFYADDYEIERVSIGRLLDAPVEARQEGETLVLPVMEEVLVYQKKMLLKEEVRVTRRRKPVDDVRRIEQPGAGLTT